MSSILSNPFVIGMIGILGTVLSAAVGQLIKSLLERLTGKSFTFTITIPKVLVFAIIMGIFLTLYVFISNISKTSSAPTPDIIKITFVTPSENDFVEQRTNVQYKIDGNIPKGYKHYILVQDPLGQYWSWGTTLDFKQNIQIGEPQDKGKTFEIGIIITNEDIQSNKPYTVRPICYGYKSIKVVRK